MTKGEIKKEERGLRGGEKKKKGGKEMREKMK